MTQEKRQQLSPDQTPPRLKPGEIRKFKLLNAGAIDQNTGHPAYNAGATFSGTSTVWDKTKNQPVIIKNITGYETVQDRDGKDSLREIVSHVEFDNTGMCYVNHKQPETYLWLARDDRNASNPFRDKSKEAVWYEVLEVNTKEREQFRFNLEYDAQTLARNPNIKEVIAIATVLAKKKLIDVNLSGPAQDIRYEVMKCCSINPKEVIRAAKDKQAILKLDIQDASNLGEIEYQHDGNAWVWPKEYENNVIHKVTPGEDPLEALAKYLLTDKDEAAAAMLKKLKNTLKELPVEAN